MNNRYNNNRGGKPKYNNRGKTKGNSYAYNSNRRIPFSAKNILNSNSELADRKKISTANLYSNWALVDPLTTNDQSSGADASSLLSTQDLACVVGGAIGTAGDSKSKYIAYEPLRFHYTSSPPTPDLTSTQKCDGRKFYYKHMDLDVNISCKHVIGGMGSSESQWQSVKPTQVRCALLGVKGNFNLGSGGSNLNLKLHEPFSSLALADSKKIWVMYDKTFIVSDTNPIHIEKFFKLNLEMNRSQLAAGGTAVAGDSPSSIDRETTRVILVIWTDDIEAGSGASTHTQCELQVRGRATAVGYEM